MVAPSARLPCRALRVRQRGKERCHGVGFRDRARVRGEAGVDARLRPRRDHAARGASPTTGERQRAVPAFAKITAPLKDEVKRQGLWAAHLPPDMGGLGFGQVKLGLMHEILGATRVRAQHLRQQRTRQRQRRADRRRAARDAQREQWMKPLLEGTYRSCFSMTEPGAGADPTLLTTSAMRDGDEWVINGHKWFSSNASDRRLPDRDVQDRRPRDAVQELLDDHRAHEHARA